MNHGFFSFKNIEDEFHPDGYSNVKYLKYMTQIILFINISVNTKREKIVPL